MPAPPAARHRPPRPIWLRIIVVGFCAGVVTGTAGFIWLVAMPGQDLLRDHDAAGAVNWSDQERAAAMVQGNDIAEALLAYRTQHGEFPPVLQRIRRDFMAHIAAPAAGVAWDYGGTPDRCWLRVVGTEHGGRPYLEWTSDRAVGAWAHYRGRNDS